MEEGTELEIAHCSSCGCKMDISALGPYTNVVCPDCGHHTRVKCELGHYLLTSRHAVGGMSMVFAARDTTLQREVAIKVLNEEYSQDEVRMQQFEHEALITAAISHPHIVRVFTVGRTYGVYFIAMEMVPGVNLEQRIANEGAIKEDELLPIASEIVSGLHAANDAGLIHRDVKPGNILFDANGHAKIVDFGLALVTQGGKAKADEVWATPYYVPPEALDGLEEDFRSDIYALGATLYHAFSGRPPISDESKSTRAVRKAKESIQPLAKVAPWLKPETCYLVDKAMQLNPDKRFSSYTEMEEAVNAAFQATQGAGASEPIHSQQRAQRRSGSKKGIVSLVITGAVALALIAGAAFVFLQNKNNSNGAGPDEVNGSDPVVGNGDATQDGVDSNDDYTPEVAAKIGRMFRRSHALLREKKYDEAKEVFVKLMNDKDVHEPAASWAGVEAVVATWLGGNSGDATSSIGKLREHLDRRQVSNTSDMGALVSQLASPGIIRDPKVGTESMSVVHLMAVALKNWEIGAWEVAAPMFSQIEKMNLPPESPLNVYREISKRYLADYNRLKPLSNLSEPATVDEARESLDELKDALSELQTRGRARFHIRVWQIRLLFRIRDLRKQAELAGNEKNKAPEYGKVMPKFRELVAEAKYAQASELLQDVSIPDHQVEEKDAWVYLTDSASAFLGGLEEVIPEAGVSMDVEGVDGKKYTQIVSSKPGGLQLKGEGGEVFVPWGELNPDSVLTIHQKAFKQTLGTLEGQLRTEQAVCYAWLAGLEDKAKRAATMLSGVNANFKKRWRGTMKAQHQIP
ncbi:hypothetical protein NT6N_08790 [Oceaniferula spumae]|uniref:Protein kinase domain-containing protein n=1 Tax=Oceaniferula spumae TaxID=2979115 RepID=A0AAT9FIP3_9BACT